MNITLNSTVNKVTQPEVKKSLSEVTIKRMVDLPEEKIVRVFIKELNSPMILWEGDAYDAIGDWTNVDVEARVNELLGA